MDILQKIKNSLQNSKLMWRLECDEDGRIGDGYTFDTDEFFIDVEASGLVYGYELYRLVNEYPDPATHISEPKVDYDVEVMEVCDANGDIINLSLEDQKELAQFIAGDFIEELF